MIGNRWKMVAVAFGIAFCLAMTTSPASAAPPPAPLSAPLSEEACGTLTSGVGFTYSPPYTLWGTGSVLQSCSGWTKLCTTLWWFTPLGATPRATKCSPLRTGLSMGHSTNRVPCWAGVYFSITDAYVGSTVVRSKSSPRYSGAC